MSDINSKRDDAISNLSLLCGESYDCWSETGVSWMGVDGLAEAWLFLEWDNDRKISVKIFNTLNADTFEPSLPKTGEMGFYAVIGYCHLHEIPISINNVSYEKL